MYEKRQLDRADAIFAWLATQIAEGTFSGDFGYAELSLICGLDWMEFRKAYPIERAAGCRIGARRAGGIARRWSRRGRTRKLRGVRGTDVAAAASILARGGLVAFPTETVYGLGGDAASEARGGEDLRGQGPAARASADRASRGR